MRKIRTASTLTILLLLSTTAIAGCSSSRESEKSSESGSPRKGDPFESAQSAATSSSWSPFGRDEAPAPSAPSAPPAPAGGRTMTETSETSVGGIVTTRRSRTVADAAAPPEDRMSLPMPPETMPPEVRPQQQPQSGLLTAGDHDDLLNPKAYAEYAGRFLQQNEQRLPFVDTRTRRRIRVVDRNGRPVPFADVTVGRSGGALRLKTAVDGTASFYPGFDRISGGASVTVRSSAGNVGRRLPDGEGPSALVVALPGTAPAVKALDVALVLDTTGSMGDEMEFLQAEIVSIVERVRRAAGNVDVRIGLIAYKDVGDEYVVRSFGMTGSAGAVRNTIASLTADGGGDTPEAVDQALAAASRMPWRENAAKAIVLIADAPPHDDRIQASLATTQAFRSRGIQMVPVAASGVEDVAQYVMRTMAVMTQGRYVFLTDDSGVGNSHAEPDLACYAVTRLNQLLARVLTGIATGRRIEPRQDEIVRTVGSYNRGRCGGELGGRGQE